MIVVADVSKAPHTSGDQHAASHLSGAEQPAVALRYIMLHFCFSSLSEVCLLSCPYLAYYSRGCFFFFSQKFLYRVDTLGLGVRKIRAGNLLSPCAVPSIG